MTPERSHGSPDIESGASHLATGCAELQGEGRGAVQPSPDRPPSSMQAPNSKWPALVKATVGGVFSWSGVITGHS